MTKQLLNQLENPLSTSHSSLPQKTVNWSLTIFSAVVLAVVVGLALFLHRPDPYVQTVLSLSGNPAQGRIIFESNCATCHGIGGAGLVGPSLHHVSTRRSRPSLIHQVVSGQTPPMPQFQPSPQEMADLLEYLEQL